MQRAKYIEANCERTCV